MDDKMKATEAKQGEPVEEVQKPAELSAEELAKAAGGAPTDPCNKIPGDPCNKLS